MENTEGFTQLQLNNLNEALVILMKDHDKDSEDYDLFEKECCNRLTNSWTVSCLEDASDPNWDWENKNSVAELVEAVRTYGEEESE